MEYIPEKLYKIAKNMPFCSMFIDWNKATFYYFII